MKNTKRILFMIMFVGISVFSHSQDQKIKISLHGGYFNIGNYFHNVVPDRNVGMDVSYFLSDRFFLTAHFNYGKSRYYDNSAATEIPSYVSTWEYLDGTNAEMILNNVGLLAGYCLPVNQYINFAGQIGFSQFIKIAKGIPTVVYSPDKYYEDGTYSFEEQYKRSLAFSSRDQAFFSAAFPVKFSIGITPFKQLNIGFAKNIEFGYAAGFYIEPDFAFFTGVYHGPQLSVSF
ncbi:MAG: hypothetical protein LBE13_14060 [Bacteroidales bacterium]|jgi:hypothetical protein|nr:hypothetical protein [Bacteroidales bacterium]